MNYETSRQFDDLVSEVEDQILRKRIKKIIEKVANAESLRQISNIRPMVGYPGYYRIKFGDYRIGISLEENTVWFLYFGKRDDNTYKKFPR